jgi:anti-sigma regulatory factor (Ser/Thr protein kinase)
MRSEVELRIPPQSFAPTLARAAVGAVGSRLPGSVVKDAELLTTEVVSNAVRHAQLAASQEIVLRVVVDGYLRVEVMDPGSRFEVDIRRPSAGTKGWGLYLVDAIATSWGVESEGSGKTVWFEVGAPLRVRPSV